MNMNICDICTLIRYLLSMYFCVGVCLTFAYQPVEEQVMPDVLVIVVHTFAV